MISQSLFGSSSISGELAFEKKFGDILDPTSRVISWFSILTLYLVLLYPSPFDLLILFLVDFSIFFIFMFFDKSIFLTLFPKAQLYFSFENKDSWKALELEHRRNLMASLMNYPEIRALYWTILGFIKAILLSLVISFIWENGFELRRILIFFLVQVIILTYSYGVFLVELQQVISEKIASLHKENDWSEVFAQRPPKLKISFFTQEKWIFFLLCFSFILVQWILFVPGESFPSRLNGILISLVGISLVSRILFLSRYYWDVGLSQLSDRIESSEFKRGKKLIPFHSSYLLSRFEYVINNFVLRTKEYQSQISNWALSRSEQARDTALGEASALIVHDLATPLHVISFCAAQIKERSNECPDPRYLDQLMDNVVRSVEVLESLRVYLRNGDSCVKGCFFFDAFSHSERVLRSQLGDKKFSKVERIIDSSIPKKIRLNMAQVDLVHIIHYLFSDSYKSLVTSEVEKPTFCVDLERLESNYMLLLFSNNGNRVSQKKIEMSSGDDYQREGEAMSEELGFRLVRSLVQRYGGDLMLTEARYSSGKTFRIKLPIYETFLR